MVSYAFTGIPFSKVTQVPSIEAILSLLPQLNFPQTINTFGRLEGKIKQLFNGKRQSEFLWSWPSLDHCSKIIQEAIKAYIDDKPEGYWLKLYHFATNIDITVFNQL